MANTMILGDIVLFEADDSCISRLICELSGSNVSHAAMYYDNMENLIVEEGLSGIQVSPAPGGPALKRRVHLRRHKDESIAREKLVGAARHYVELKEPYSLSNLALVGVLLITERFIKEKPYSRAVMFFLKLACSALADAINKKMNPGQLPMTCSQLVSQCYTDAGYSLRFDNKLFAGRATDGDEQSLAAMALARLRQHNLMPAETPDMARWTSGAQSDAGFLESMLQPDDDELRSALANLKTFNSGEILDAVCCVILKLIQKEGRDSLQAAETPEELLALAVRFASLTMQLERPSEEVDSAPFSSDSAIEKILELRNIFVSPGDLLDHCTDLRDAGTIEPSA